MIFRDRTFCFTKKIGQINCPIFDIFSIMRSLPCGEDSLP